MFMLLHELSHIHHRDTWWILLISALRALYWFNPLVWIGSYYAICDLELRCDEEVLAQCGTDKAPAYAKKLVDTARGSKPQTTYACSTYISRALKERIKAIMKMKKRNLKTQIIGVILLLILISTAIFGMEALVQIKERLLAQPNPKNFTSDEYWPLYTEDGVTIVGRFIPAKADVTHFNQD